MIYTLAIDGWHPARLKGSIRNYEQGQRESYWQVVFKLADALGVSSEAFKVCINASQSKARPSPAKHRGKRK